MEKASRESMEKSKEIDVASCAIHPLFGDAMSAKQVRNYFYCDWMFIKYSFADYKSSGMKNLKDILLFMCDHCSKLVFD